MAVATMAPAYGRVPLQETARYTISVSKTGNGSGAVVSDPQGIDCGDTCETTYDAGAEVLLMAQPDEGSRFVGWSDPCGSGALCGVTVDKELALVARFELELYRHSRILSLRLRKHLVASGEVRSDGPRSCTRGVIVTIERRFSSGWRRAARVRTGSNSSYRVQLPDQVGSYRASIPEITLDEQNTCLGLSGGSLRHSH